MLEQTIEPDIAEEAKMRQVELAGTRPETLATNDAKVRAPRSVDGIAKKVGLGSGRTYERAKQVIDAVTSQPDGDHLMARVEAGT
ncbi:MAG: hypothetical protein ACR2OO_05225 [Thermomicrobiales bacterium]